MQPQPGQVGRYIGVGVKRMSDQNHNKAITKRLASAVHYQQVLDVIADSVQHFDEVNVATSLHRLAKLQPNTGSNQCSALVYTPQFQQLVAAIKRLLHRFEAQAVSNTMWAFATLAYYPEGDLLDQIASHAISIMPTFRPQATSNTLWAYAKLAYAPSPAMLKASADQLERDLAKSVPQDISNTLWAFATLRHYPGRSLMAGAAAQAIITIQRFKPQEIANTLWAYATLAQDPGPGLLDAMAAQMVDRIAQFRPQAVSNSLWAYAKLGYNPGREMLDVAARKASHMLHQYTSQEIANTLWSLATLEHHPGVQMLDLAAHQIVRRIEQFSPQDIANSVWAFAKIYHYPSCDLLQAAAHYCLRHWHRFKPQEVANMFWALAILKPGAPETWRALLDKLALVPAASFDEADQHQIFQAYLLLEGQGSQLGTPSVASLFPPGLLEDAATIWKQAIHRSGRMSKLQEEVSRVLWSLGVIHRTDHITMDGLFCVDIALENDRVIIEVDGPSHFAVNSRRPLGRTIGHRSMLEARGYIVRSIPYYEWNVLEGIEEQKRYASIA
ncbi:hypothetical protein WJX72_002182 [[Myrmecia] bisecta]|uniref:RAP domain-containing protein n=1 Tax=[Myrmecia] bisecta TaxID=41462 RepID=A0AAW1QEX5_9CHLO